MKEDPQGGDTKGTRFRRALLKPDEHGQVSDEAIANFVRALGFDPETLPKTEVEAEAIRRERRRQRLQQQQEVAEHGIGEDGEPGRA